MLFSVILFSCICVPLGFWVICIVKQGLASHRRIKRMGELKNIICSTQYTSDQRRAAMEELLTIGSEIR